MYESEINGLLKNSKNTHTHTKNTLKITVNDVSSTSDPNSSVIYYWPAFNKLQHLTSSNTLWTEFKRTIMFRTPDQTLTLYLD